MSSGSYRKIPIDDYLYPAIAEVLRPGVMQPPPAPKPGSWWEEDETESARGRRTPIMRSFDARPTEVSLCRELALAGSWPRPIYDVNGYYRALGIGWPFRPTRRELREAYRDCGGPEDEFATYALKRLLDPEVRARYDARPAGQPMDDKYRWIELKRAAARWAAEQTLATGRKHDSAEFVAPDILAKMEAEVLREQTPADEQPSEDPVWEFGYFRWEAVRAIDPARLSQWQAMLMAACWAAGVSGRFAVGVMGDQPHQAARVSHHGHDIAFLDEDTEPTPELAAEVVAHYLTFPLNREFDSPITIDLMNSGSVTKDDELVLRPSASMRSQTPEEESMPEEEAELDFATGGLQAAEFAKAAAAARKAQYGQSYITSYLAEDGDKVIVRFLTDEPDLIETPQHSFVQTKPPPRDKPADKGWPESLSAVCRYLPVGPDRHPAFSDCFICDVMRDDKGKKLWPTTRLWGLAALREEVLGTEEMVKAGQIQPQQLNSVVSYRDKTEEMDELDANGKPTGRKVQRKIIVIVNMAQSNFWSPLMTNKIYFKTIVDRDYLVVRKGARQQGGGKRGGKVAYEFVPLPPTYVPHPETGQPVQLDLRDPKLAAAYEGHGMNLAKLRKHVSRLASDRFYHRFFDTRYEVPYSEDEDSSAPGGSSQPSPASQAAAQQAGQVLTSEPTSGPTAEQLAAMRADLLAENPVVAPPSNGAAQGQPVVAPL
jgi:hypothetical protein